MDNDYPLMTVITVALAGGMFTLLVGEAVGSLAEPTPVIVSCSVEISDSTGNRATLIGEGILYE